MTEPTNKTQTKHIQKMLTEACAMAAFAHGKTEHFIEWHGVKYTRDQFLARAANLAGHAGEELMDEAFTSAGFPVVL